MLGWKQRISCSSSKISLGPELASRKQRTFSLSNRFLSIEVWAFRQVDFNSSTSKAWEPSEPLSNIEGSFTSPGRIRPRAGCSKSPSKSLSQSLIQSLSIRVGEPRQEVTRDFNRDCKLQDMLTLDQSPSSHQLST